MVQTAVQQVENRLQTINDQEGKYLTFLRLFIYRCRTNAVLPAHLVTSTVSDNRAEHQLRILLYPVMTRPYRTRAMLRIKNHLPLQSK